MNTKLKTGLALVTLLAAIAVTPGCGDLKANANFVVDSVAYAPDGTLVVFTNGGILLFDDPTLATTKGRIALDGLTTLETEAQYQYSLSRDGTTVAAAYAPPSGAAARVAVYRVPGGERLNVFDAVSEPDQPVPNRLETIALSPHGDLLAVAQPSGTSGKPFAVMDTGTGAVRWTMGGRMIQPVWSPDGVALYTLDTFDASMMGTVLQGSDAHSGPQFRQPLSRDVQALAYLGATNNLAGLASPLGCLPNCPVTFPFFLFIDGQMTAELPGPPNAVPAFGFLGRPVFTCSSTDDVCAAQLTDNATGTWVQIYRKDGTVLAMIRGGYFSSVALSPDGQYLAASDFRANVADPFRVVVYRIADGTLVGSRAFAMTDVL